MEILIRKMQETDIVQFPKEFALQGWNKPAEQFRVYYDEQSRGERQVFVATADGKIAGYATLLPHDRSGPFKDTDIPMIVDFNVLIKYQKRGIGTAILDYIENLVSGYSAFICLGVGLHHGYGAAQRMYVKRGYVPDGSGVWFNGERLEPYKPCVNDDTLILYFLKQMR